MTETALSSRDASRQVILDARSLSPTEFCARYPTAFFVGEKASSPLPGGLVDLFATACAPIIPPDSDDPMDLFPATAVIPLRKTASNPFTPHITIGRAAVNDVRLEVPTVSKLHASLRRCETGAWRIADRGSQNGTWVQSKLITLNEEVAIRDGDAVSFGPAARYRFFEARTLYHLIRGFVLEKTPAPEV